MVVDAVHDGSAMVSEVRRLGPALVFERVWDETGCRAVIEELAGERKHGFALERAVFLTVLHRLFAGGSDRAADRWRDDYRIDGVAGLDLHHLYRAMAWLGEELPAKDQDGRTLAPRCLKDVMEERLFAKRRDLFTKLDLVFMDTTSLYFEGAGGQTLGRHGYSKDHRPDLHQMILAVLLDSNGRPVCTEMWPGNTADTGSLVPVVDRLRKRFSIGRVCIVADRGMISAETIAELEARGLLYILGVRERSDKLVRDLVLDDPAPFVPLTITKRRKSVDYEAKAVTLAGRRYIVCRNHEEAKKDAADRAAILAALERQLKKGDKALVGNTGYRRFLASTSEDRFAVDYAKAEEDAKFDGVFVLRTNTDLAPLDAMLCYKQLTMVEQTFRTAKSLFANHSRSRVLQLPRSRPEEGVGGAHRRPRSQGLMAGYPRRPRLAHRDQGRAGRQMLSAALATASRRQPRAFRRRRRSPANRPPGRPGLIPTSSSADVVPTRPNASDTPGRSISWISALLKMSQTA